MIPLALTRKLLNDPPIHRRTHTPRDQQQARNLPPARAVPQPRCRQDRSAYKNVFRTEKNHDGVHDFRITGCCWGGEADSGVGGTWVERVCCAEAEEDRAKEGGENTKDGVCGEWHLERSVGLGLKKMVLNLVCWSWVLVDLGKMIVVMGLAFDRLKSLVEESGRIVVLLYLIKEQVLCI